MPLGIVAQPRRGIFTGANDVFIRSRSGFADELGEAVTTFVRPVTTGSDLAEDPKLEIVWPYDRSGNLIVELPDVLVEYFARHAPRLRARSDFNPRLPLWQMFRVRESTLGPKVAWRDMSVLLEPTRMSPDCVPLNTVYYLSCDDEERAARLCDWMSSTPVRAYGHALAERARGGWRRHFAWVMRMLPFPRSWVDAVPAGKVADAFGLSHDDLRVLERWLSGDVARLQEAA